MRHLNDDEHDKALEAALRAVERQGLRLHMRDLKHEIRDLERALDTGVDPYHHYAIEPYDHEERQQRLVAVKRELNELIHGPMVPIAIWEEQIERRGPVAATETIERRKERAS